MLGGAGSPGGEELLTVTIVRDEHGYGMKVSGDNPVYVQSVKEQGAAWRAGLRAGDRILRVDRIPVHHHTHQEVVQMIRANATTVLTVQQNTARHKTPITAPQPVNPEKQRQLEVSKVHTVRLMLEKEQKYIRELRNELSKVPDVRKQAQLESAEQRCAILQHEIDAIMSGQTDNRASMPVLHVRSQSSPEHLDQGCGGPRACSERAPPPGTPPPPYAHDAQPCADPQRAIISMEEDDSPNSDSSTYSGLFSNLNTVRESKARMAVLLNWLIGERRSPHACLVLLLTDAYRAAPHAEAATLRRWAYELHSTFLVPNAVLQLNGVDENMANEIEHVLVNEYEKEEVLRNVFRKARQKAKEVLAAQLAEFQNKRRVGLGTLYGPPDEQLLRADGDLHQEQIIVERIMVSLLSAASRGAHAAHSALLAALIAAAHALKHCRPAAIAAAVGGNKPCFLMREKLYKQRVKQLNKQNPQPFVVRGHHLQLTALHSVAHCHHCDLAIWGLAPQAYVCTDCKLRIHRLCARSVEEACCLDNENNSRRISRFMERIHSNQPNSQEEKKSKKSSSTAHFLNMERSFRKTEEEPTWDQTLTPASNQGESKRDGSTEETVQDGDADGAEGSVGDATDKEHSNRAAPSSGRGVNRAESCRERDAPRRGKQRNASDPNRLTAANHRDLEPGSATAPSGSSSSSSLSSRSNESNTVANDQQASQSDWSEDDEPLPAQWVDSLPPDVLETLSLSSRLRKRQEVIHELIVSEGSHVRWLKVLRYVFLVPLERARLLPPDELKALFPNLPAVRERHARLYRALREAREGGPTAKAVAEALSATLGDSGYAPCLARFCRAQRLALDALKERRKKSKELHQFLQAREQLPLCARLQLRDLLACVWQRLTKYQLLLENILKTVDTDPNSEESDSEEEAAALRHALSVAKEVLQTVDTAIRTTENQHRLKQIQSKLEVRANGAEWDELRRLELCSHALRHEGELAIRHDAHKKIAVTALLLERALVLLQREGDRFVLRPLPQPGQPAALSPLVHWDKVLFRENAAVRNTFFLMNINGVQMHELSANTSQEYGTWVKHIQESPLAKLTELKPNITPSHHSSRSTDDSGINVSRNPSDASEKSSNEEERASVDRASERDRTSVDRTVEKEKERASADRVLQREKSEKERASEDLERVKEKEEEKREEVNETEERKPRRPTTGRITTHGRDSIPALEPVEAVLVRPPPDSVHVAERVVTDAERLRRLDESISSALRAKSLIVSSLLSVPAGHFADMADLAVADSLGQLEVPPEIRSSTAPDLHQLLLAAHAQVNQLTETLSRALSVSETRTVSARSGKCDRCAANNSLNKDESNQSMDKSALFSEDLEPSLSEESRTTDTDVDPERVEGDFVDGDMSAAELASRLVGVASGLQRTVGALVAALPAGLQRDGTLRRELAGLRDARDRREYQMTDEESYTLRGVDQNLEDQQSNGG